MPSFFYRVEEVPVRHLLAVRADPGHPGGEEPEDEGPGLCDLQGGQQRLQRTAVHAGIPLLRQAHGASRCLTLTLILQRSTGRDVSYFSRRISLGSSHLIG